MHASVCVCVCVCVYIRIYVYASSIGRYQQLSPLPTFQTCWPPGRQPGSHTRSLGPRATRKTHRGLTASPCSLSTLFALCDCCASRGSSSQYTQSHFETRPFLLRHPLTVSLISKPAYQRTTRFLSPCNRRAVVFCASMALSVPRQNAAPRCCAGNEDIKQTLP
jgi:hypothetical protein